MTPAEIRELVQKFGLGTRAQDIAALTQPAVELALDAPSSISAVGVSRVGGNPDLPPGIEWPRWKDRSLAFIAQVNLADVTGFAGVEALPSTGILSFFYDAEQSTWGFDPDDRGSFRVLHLASDVEPRSHPSDVPEEARYPARVIRLLTGHTLPAPDSRSISDLCLSETQEDAYFELYDFVMPEGGRSLLLGHPDQIQGDMQLECALVNGGLYCGDASGYQDPRAADLRRTASEWRLLLQIGSDEDAGMMWGDAGCLYYWIRMADLEVEDFSKAWMILQCG